MELEVVPLQFAVAEHLAKELADVLGARRHGPTVRIVADPRTNSLILKGPREDLAEVLALVAKLDVKKT